MTLPALPASAADAPAPVATTPLPAHARRTGDVPLTAPVDVQVVLKRRNQAALEALLAQPGHAPLAQEEIRSRFGPDPGLLSDALAFLRSRGFSSISTSADGLLVSATAPASAVEAAFRTRLGDYRDEASGEQFRSNDSPPLLPGTLASGVVAVHGLSTRAAARRSASVLPHAGLGPNGGYTPAQLRSAYNLNAGVLAGTTGTGVTIGLFELDDYDQAHISMYDAQYYPAPATPPSTPVPVPVNGGFVPPNPTPACCGGRIEVELDIEVIHAIAPQATVRVYEAQNTQAGQNAAYNLMLKDKVDIISTSWGLCEQKSGSSELNTLHSIFQSASLAGINVFAASGDFGAYDCNDPSSPSPLDGVLSVDSPAGDPNVIGVGGTRMLTSGSDSLGYGSETAWSASPLGSGGGVSAYWAAPGWQVGDGVANAARQVPDVSFDADQSPGISTYTYTSDIVGDPGGWRRVGGTSAGAPAWAAYNALYNEYAIGAGSVRLANAGPNLYAAAVCHGALAPFHDTGFGNNLFYSATPGFDLATGWGSMNGGDLASTLHTLAAGGTPISVRSVTPGTGSTTGGNVALVNGCGFASGATATFGGVSSPSSSAVNFTTVRATVPGRTAIGDADVTVTNPGPTSATLPAGYHYNRAPGHQQLVTNRDGRLEMTITGPDAKVYHGWENSPSGPIGTFYSLGAPAGGAVSDPAAGLNQDGRIEVFVLGADGALWHVWQNAPNAGWTPTFASLGLPGGGALRGVPSVATNTDGRLEVFARAADGRVWHTWQVSPSGAWGPWYSLGFGGAAGPGSDVAAGRNGDGRLEIFAADGAGTVLHSWQTAPSGGWTGFSPLGGRAITGAPGVNTNRDGRLEVFAQAADDASVVHSWQNVPSGGWTGWYSLGGAVTSDVSVARNSDGRLEFFALDPAGNLVHTWQLSPGGGWYGPLSLGQPGERLRGVPQTATNTDGRVQALVPGSSAGTEWQTFQVAAGAGWSGWSALSGHALAY
jgi:kumamolisin